MNDDIRRISIDEREYILTESQLRQMLEIAGRHHGRDSYLGRISSFSAGLGTATGIALLTVPSISFQGVGAVAPGVIYGGCIAIFAGSVLTAIIIQVTKRLGVFGKAMSTDAVMASLLNPQDQRPTRYRPSSGGPPMALRTDDRGRELSDQKPVPLLEAAPKALVRRRDEPETGASDVAERDEPLKTNSEIVRGVPDLPSPKLSPSQILLLSAIRSRGIIAKVILAEAHSNFESDLDYLKVNGLVTDAGSTVFLTAVGRILSQNT